MKKIAQRAAVLALFSPLAAFAQGGKYVVSGRIKPIMPNAKAYLVRTTSDGRKVDSVAMHDGTFKFSGVIDMPQNATLKIDASGLAGIASPNNKESKIMIESGNIKVTSKDSANTIDVVGGRINADNNKLNRIMAEVNKKEDALYSEFRNAPAEKKNSQDFVEGLKKRLTAIAEEKEALYKKFIEENRGSLMSIFALKQFAGPIMVVSKVEPLFNSLSANVRDSKLGKAYAAEIEKNNRIGIGAVAPDFTAKDTLGKEVSLHDFKGKYVLVDFWASWCGPCRAENPNVAKAYGRYHEKGFEVLGVSLDQLGSKDKWIKAIHDDHLTWTQVSTLRGSEDQVAALYSVRAIPQNFLIAPDGKIVAKNLRGEDLDKKLKEIFGK